MEEYTLWNFIEENQKQLAVIGVFLAGATFAGRAQIMIIGQILSFIFVGSALLVWGELFYRLGSDKRVNARFRLFLVFFIAAFGTVVIYWILEFNGVMRFALAAILLRLLYTFVPWLQREKNRRWEFVVGLILFIVTLGFAAAINNGVDRFKSYLMSKQPTSIVK